MTDGKKKNVCPFCDGITEEHACVDRTLAETEADFGMFGTRTIELALVKLPLSGRTPELRAGLYDGHVSADDVIVGISYCPFCGRRLVTEKEEG